MTHFTHEEYVEILKLQTLNLKETVVAVELIMHIQEYLSDGDLSFNNLVDAIQDFIIKVEEETAWQLTNKITMRQYLSQYIEKRKKNTKGQE